MTSWEWLVVILSSAALFASILGAFVTYATRKNREATRDQQGCITLVPAARVFPRRLAV